MSISTELQSLNNNILGAYTAIQGKDGTVPENKNMENLPAAIESIPSGGSGGGIGIPREVNANGVYGVPTQSLSFSLPSGVIDVSGYAISNAFRGCNSITSVNLSSLTKVTGTHALEYAFYSSSLRSIELSSLATVKGESAFNGACGNCNNLVSVDFPALAVVDSGNAFNSAFSGCRGITSAGFPALTTINGSYAFSGAFMLCSRLASISFPSLTTINGINVFSYGFSGCTLLTSVDFPALTTASGGSRIFDSAFNNCANLVSVNFSSLAIMDKDSTFNNAFYGCTKLTSISFPALTASSFGSYTSQFNQMLYRCADVTVHFPAAIESTIGSWNSVTSGFGGTNTTVLFDL